MVARTRSRFTGAQEGSFTSSAGTTKRSALIQVSTNMDVIPGRDHSLTIRHDYHTNPCLTHYDVVGKKLANNFPLTAFDSPSGNYGSGSFSAYPASRPSNSTLAVSLLKATNPSSSYVDLPVAIFELRELPDLVRSFGRQWYKKIASSNLKYEFGIKPLVSDFRKLLDFQRRVQNRVKLLQKLQQGSIVRKVQLWSDSVVQGVNTSFVSNSSPTGCFINHKWTTRTITWKTWGYVRWTPKPPLMEMAPDDLQNLAQKAVLGLTVDSSTLWEALPWSWLIDWYSNVGDYLAANRNLVPCTPSTPVLCETRRVELSAVSGSNNINLAPGAHTATRVSIQKTRTPVSAALPSADLPLLTGRQVGILTSLAALRWR